VCLRFLPPLPMVRRCRGGATAPVEVAQHGSICSAPVQLATVSVRFFIPLDIPLVGFLVRVLVVAELPILADQNRKTNRKGTFSFKLKFPCFHRSSGCDVEF